MHGASRGRLAATWGPLIAAGAIMLLSERVLWRDRVADRAGAGQGGDARYIQGAVAAFRAAARPLAPQEGAPQAVAASPPRDRPRQPAPPPAAAAAGEGPCAPLRYLGSHRKAPPGSGLAFAPSPNHAQRNESFRVISAEPINCGLRKRTSLDDVRRYYLERPCEVVVVTSIFGGYDDPPPDPPGVNPADLASRRLCLVFITDKRTDPAQGGRLWERHVLQKLPWPKGYGDSRGWVRCSTTVKLLSLRLFEKAHTIIAHDGKLEWRRDPLAALRLEPHASFVAPASLWVNTTDQEFESELYHLGRIRNTTHHDCFRISLQYQDYVVRKYLPQEIPGALDSGWLLLRRGPCLERLMCVWFNEFVKWSHREQLSFFFAVDALGMRPAVSIISVDLWNQYARNRWRHRRTPRANGACRDVPTAFGPLCKLVPKQGFRCRGRGLRR
eukprot:TRINITY_DN30151_c0_g1_i1.p1 TRINITY_DN30151_c0_g1~~TRINITY_DN30151_c0_g1_i1.p1  ORF type:complete len:442 (+),score=115.90 TRINITY_DN30151_c0_g1_i1:94-1419(+)